MGVTTDIDMLVAGKVKKVQSWMEGSRVGDSEESTRGLSEGRRMEVWVREGKKSAFARRENDEGGLLHLTLSEQELTMT
jgi:hypothetical protein